eukprot:3130893-Alexandrium_andersonii.AAC.1
MIQIWAPPAQREARRQRRLPRKRRVPSLTDSGPRRGPSGPLGKLGPRPPKEGAGAKCPTLTE